MFDYTYGTRAKEIYSTCLNFFSISIIKSSNFDYGGRWVAVVDHTVHVLLVRISTKTAIEPTPAPTTNAATTTPVNVADLYILYFYRNNLCERRFRRLVCYTDECHNSINGTSNHLSPNWNQLIYKQRSMCQSIFKAIFAHAPLYTYAIT